jgi:D-3-phosphoglycerate dehydrogenase / 2-oxoglutarate reductase
MIDILISENISGSFVDALHSRFQVSSQPNLWEDRAALFAAVASARALIVRNKTDVSAELLKAGKHLIAVGRAGVGLDNIDLESANELGVVVTCTPDQNSISVAELTIGLMIALARKIPAAAEDTRAGHWNRQQFMGTELYGKTFGIIGAGKIGFLTASRARAFGMHVLAYDPYVSEDNVLVREAQAELVELDELLSRSDVVSCHVPGSPQTDGLINRDRLQHMKPTAFFINTARGQVVNEADLIDALRTGKIAGAALDVRCAEPPRITELDRMPNVILTPHIAAFTNEAQSRVTRVVCEDIARLLDGQPAKNVATRFNVPQRKI